MQTVALVILIAASIWLVAVGIAMAWRPATCIRLLGKMASTQRINLAEQALRGSAGAAMVVRAAHSKAPLLFEVAGWFIVATSILLIFLPLRWHAAFAIWWSQTLRPGAVRALSPVAAALGTALSYASL